MSSHIIILRSTTCTLSLATCPYEAVISFNTEYQSPNSRINTPEAEQKHASGQESSNQAQSHFLLRNKKSAHQHIRKLAHYKEVTSILPRNKKSAPFDKLKAGISTSAHQHISTLNT